MDFITTEHLEKYEAVLQKIQDELEACKQLEKQIKNENDKIVAANISFHEDVMRNKLFRVNVRVFDTIFEIYDHCGTTFELPAQCRDCKFYLVEVYVSTVFQDKLADQKWILNVRIRSSSNRVVSQSLNLKNKALFAYPLIAVLPFDGAEHDCKVEATLALPARNFWTNIKLEDVNVDVSYYFKINTESGCNARNVAMDIINVCRCYCEESFLVIVEDVKEATFSYHSTITEFLKYLVWNCYHRVDPEVYSALEKSETLNIEIKTDNFDVNNRILICFNPEESVLKIKTTIRLMYEVKKYFIRGTNEKQVALNRKGLKEFCVCSECNLLMFV